MSILLRMSVSFEKFYYIENVEKFEISFVCTAHQILNILSFFSLLFILCLLYIVYMCCVHMCIYNSFLFDKQKINIFFIIV